MIRMLCMIFNVLELLPCDDEVISCRPCQRRRALLLQAVGLASITSAGLDVMNLNLTTRFIGRSVSRLTLGDCNAHPRRWVGSDDQKLGKRRRRHS